MVRSAWPCYTFSLCFDLLFCTLGGAVGVVAILPFMSELVSFITCHDEQGSHLVPVHLVTPVNPPARLMLNYHTQESFGTYTNHGVCPSHSQKPH
jgi:hypothetical protein